MLIYMLRRVLIAIPTILVLMFVVFLLAEAAPGDPAMKRVGDNATPEQVAEAREALGLDRPLLARYVEYVGSAARGDFGESAVTGRPVLEDLQTRIPVTLSLVVLGILFTVLIAIPLGTVAALTQGTLVDTAISVVATLLMSLPSFLVGLLLILGLAISTPLFPATGYATIGDGLGPWLTYGTLPALALALVPAALITRQVRGALLEAMAEDYVRTARAKGLRRGAIVGKHVAKNAAVPVITVLSLQLAYMIGGSVVIERLFAMPGVGALGIDSVLNGDLITLQGLVLFSALVVLIVNLLADLSYGYFNPRLARR